MAYNINLVPMHGLQRRSHSCIFFLCPTLFALHPSLEGDWAEQARDYRSDDNENLGYQSVECRAIWKNVEALKDRQREEKKMGTGRRNCKVGGIKGGTMGGGGDRKEEREGRKGKRRKGKGFNYNHQEDTSFYDVRVLDIFM